MKVHFDLGDIGVKNQYAISILMWRTLNGVRASDFAMKIAQLAQQEVCEALCKMRCVVLRNGYCKHGCPSVVLEMGQV